MSLTHMSYSVFGTPGADRLVVLVGTGVAMTTDPLPTVTATHDIQVLAVALEGSAIDEPGAFGGQTPAEQTAVAVAELILSQQRGSRTVGVIAYRDAGEVALRAVESLGGIIDRLALVAVPLPETPLDKSELAGLLSRIPTATLVLNGADDDIAGKAEADWFEDHLVDGEVEITTDLGDDLTRMSLVDVWERTLQHVAPATERVFRA